MDSNIHYRQINPNHNKSSSMTKFWSQKQNVLPEGMPQKLNYQKRYMKYMVDLLNEETFKDRRKKNLYNIFKNENDNVSSSRIEEHLSDNVKKMLKKIGKNVNHIKRSIIDITKMNGLYLEEKAKKTFFRTHQFNKGSLSINNKNNSALDLKKRKTQSNINIRGNNDITSIIENSEKNDKNNEIEKKQNKNDRNEKEKENDYTKNFVYVNDNYRRQL